MLICLVPVSLNDVKKKEWLRAAEEAVSASEDGSFFFVLEPLKKSFRSKAAC